MDVCHEQSFENAPNIRSLTSQTWFLHGTRIESKSAPRAEHSRSGEALHGADAIYHL